MIRRTHIRSYEIGLHFRNGEFISVFRPGTHWLFDPLMRSGVEIVSQRDPMLVHEKLDMIIRSEVLTDDLTILDLKDHQRALVWIDGRFSRILEPGLHAWFTRFRKVDVETIDVTDARFEHPQIRTILSVCGDLGPLTVHRIDQNHEGLFFQSGQFGGKLAPGVHAFWDCIGNTEMFDIDLRETAIDVSGQEIMTLDKVTLRLNALMTYKIVDSMKAISQSDDARQSLYRETQLAIRAVVGARKLDDFLTEKEIVAAEILTAVRDRATELGIEIKSVGIRDVILPGEMKSLMNKVTEAQKAAEANLIVRREETAAMRSQANTAKVLGDNPTLMRLRELEVLERIASSGKLNVVLGEKGLADHVTNLL